MKNHEPKFKRKSSFKPFCMGAICMYALLLTCFEAGRVNGNVWASKERIQTVALYPLEVKNEPQLASLPVEVTNPYTVNR